MARSLHVEVAIAGPDDDRRRELTQALTRRGISVLEPTRGDVAGRPLRRRISRREIAEVESVIGGELPISVFAGPSGNAVVVVRLPDTPPTQPAQRDETETKPPFVEITEQTVRVGRVVLPRNERPHPLAPSERDLAHFCITTRVASTLEALALSMKLDEPTLLSGPCGTAKSSAVLALCSWLRRPTLRLSLHRDVTSDVFTGRYVPNSLDGARAWRYADGALATVMKGSHSEGHFVLLCEELNTVESSVLESMNAVLERGTRKLVVSDNDHEVVTARPGGLSIIGTMNVSHAGRTYAGRNALSPAFLDRWRAHKICTPFTEEDCLQLLRFCVLGVVPSVSLGREYRGGTVTPAFPALAELHAADPLLRALARFHAAISAAQDGPDGPLSLAQGNERVCTVRALLSILDYWALHAGVDESKQVIERALERYYVEPLLAVDARGFVNRLITAHGLRS
jgi:hypothetical protein